MTLTLLDCPPRWLTRPLQRIDDIEDAFNKSSLQRRKVGAIVDAQVSIIPPSDNNGEVNFVFPKMFLRPRSDSIDSNGAEPDTLPESVSFSLPGSDVISLETPEGTSQLGVQLSSFTDERILNSSDGALLLQLRVDVEPEFVQHHYLTKAAEEESMLKEMYDRTGINSTRSMVESNDTHIGADGFTEISIPSISTGTWSFAESVCDSSTWSDVGDMRMT